jgi:preprotein translocase subunit SecF
MYRPMSVVNSVFFLFFFGGGSIPWFCFVLVLGVRFASGGGYAH